MPVCKRNQTESTGRSDRGLFTAPQCGAWTRVPLPSRMCWSTFTHWSLHSWKSQNYAGHTWFSHQKKIVVADYTPHQRT